LASWTCVWGEAWGSAYLEGLPTVPTRVFYGMTGSGTTVLMRAEPDGADLVEVDPGQAAQRASHEADRWAGEIEAAYGAHFSE